jgi:serine/threonine-protein kinase
VQLATRHLVEGDKLGKYEVLRRIANGSMTELYLARTVGGIEKLLVVKRILPQCVSNASCVEMFLEETQLAATLHHPNVVQVHDIGLADGNYFFTMEHVHGADLERIADAAAGKAVSISTDAALTIATGLCAGLHYVHDKAGAGGTPLGIVHCDVSPSNVVVSHDGAVKLLDFGMAGVATFHPHMVRSGLKGKLAYCPPELCRASDPFDRRSDIFSVGAILYRLLTGRLPFSGKTELELRQQITSGPPPLPSSIVPGCPPALEQIVMRALARDVEQRFASALDLQAALEDFAHEARLRVSPLLLSRLMGELFPTRSEEWVHASTLGGSLVEEDITRALIENDRHAEGPAARDAAGPALTPPRTQQIRRATPTRSMVVTIPSATARASSPTIPPRVALPPLPPIPAVAPHPPSPARPPVATPSSSRPFPAITPRLPSSSLPAVWPRPPSTPPVATPAQVPLEHVEAIATPVDVPVQASSEELSLDWSWPHPDESPTEYRDEGSQPRRSLRRLAGAAAVACGLGVLALNQGQSPTTHSAETIERDPITPDPAPPRLDDTAIKPIDSSAPPDKPSTVQDAVSAAAPDSAGSETDKAQRRARAKRASVSRKSSNRVSAEPQSALPTKAREEHGSASNQAWNPDSPFMPERPHD